MGRLGFRVFGSRNCVKAIVFEAGRVNASDKAGEIRFEIVWESWLKK
jgi:hypothetical protein